MRTFILIFFLFIYGCATTPSHVGEVHKDKEGDEFSIKDTDTGFIVAGHYSEYQFIRNSRKGFTGCTNLINNAAKEYAASKEKKVEIPTWNEITIVDHGRDIITATMNVNCQYEYDFSYNEDDVVKKLSKLKELYDTGALTEIEYKTAKDKVLTE